MKNSERNELPLKELQDLLSKSRQHRRRAIEFILGNEVDVAIYSQREIARRANVPPATLSRLAKALGFPNYGDMRDVYVSAFKSAGHGNTFQASKLRSIGAISSERFFSEYVSGEVFNVENTFARLNKEDLVEAVNLIQESRKCIVFGRRTMFPVAQSFAYTLGKAFSNVFMYADQGGISGYSLCDFNMGDVAVVFALRPYSSHTIRFTELMVSRRIRVVAITDSIASPLSAIADTTLLVTCESISFPDSVIGAHALAGLIVAIMVARSEKDALSRIADDQENMLLLGEFEHLSSPLKTGPDAA